MPVTLLVGNDPVARSLPVAWACDELRAALVARGLEAAANPSKTRIRIAGRGDAFARSAAEQAGIALPETAESLALFRVGDDVVAWGADARGLAYAVTDLADRIECGEPESFGNDLPLVETPATRIRCIARTIANEKEDRGWFNDRGFWSGYLSMLARNRFNRFSLMLGIQYDYPYHNNVISDVYFHFPYPFLVAPAGHAVRIAGLPDSERDANLDVLRFIGRECARRGLDFQLGLWTQRYDFDDARHATYQVDGVVPETFAAYCRDSIAAILAAVPEITGLTFRIHVEGGIAEGDYAFWRMAFSGVTAAGRPIEINMHAKGLDEATIDVARQTGLPVAVSPKYLAEHMGLPYHASAIREREYPPKVEVTNREKLSLGARKFLRYSYGDLLSADRDWKVIYRMWPGTQRVLMWGDPLFAAQYGRSASFCGSDGLEWMEPLTFKGRAGSGVTGGRFGYRSGELATQHDWQKYAYQYRLWGRLSYAPDAGANTWRRYLRHHYGDAAADCEHALSSGSRILPLVTQTHGPSVANNNYWPEIYTNLSVLGEAQRRPYGFDMDLPLRFGNAPTFDPQLVANAREYVAAILKGARLRSYTPMDVAGWLERLAHETEVAIATLRSSGNHGSAHVQRLVVDCEIQAALGRFFAAKYRAACWAELFLATLADDARREAIRLLKQGRIAWRTAAQVSSPVSQDDLGFGAAAHLRGSWQARLADLDREINEAEMWRQEEWKPETAGARAVAPDVFQRAVATLGAPTPVRTVEGTMRARPSFVAGQPFEVAMDGAAAADDAMLHYRRVNQAERWQGTPMRRGGDGLVGTIPAGYTDSPFHLQFYVTGLRDNAVSIAPGLGADLATQPYWVALRE
jgi:hypothetical protein